MTQITLQGNKVTKTLTQQEKILIMLKKYSHCAVCDSCNADMLLNGDSWKCIFCGNIQPL